MTRERLVLAVLARPQPRDGRLVVGAAGEVVAAQALDRERSRRRAAPPRPRRIASSPAGVAQPHGGPQSGHALGWAWKRRSAGSSYSARQRSHIAKPAIVVSGRS